MTTTLNELIPEEDGVRLEFKSQLVKTFIQSTGGVVYVC